VVDVPVITASTKADPPHHPPSTVRDFQAVPIGDGVYRICRPETWDLTPTDGRITGVKISASLIDADVEFLDSYAAETGRPSRSAALHDAVEALRNLTLQDMYEVAWDEWASEAEIWEATAKDGLADETW
jgi:hypothetical protein